jgi:hypothetical protein
MRSFMGGAQPYNAPMTNASGQTLDNRGGVINPDYSFNSLITRRPPGSPVVGGEPALLQAKSTAVTPPVYYGPMTRPDRPQPTDLSNMYKIGSQSSAIPAGQGSALINAINSYGLSPGNRDKILGMLNTGRMPTDGYYGGLLQGAMTKATGSPYTTPPPAGDPTLRVSGAPGTSLSNSGAPNTNLNNNNNSNNSNLNINNAVGGISNSANTPITLSKMGTQPFPGGVKTATPSLNSPLNPTSQTKVGDGNNTPNPTMADVQSALQQSDQWKNRDPSGNWKDEYGNSSSNFQINLPGIGPAVWQVDASPAGGHLLPLNQTSNYATATRYTPDANGNLTRGTYDPHSIQGGLFGFLGNAARVLGTAAATTAVGTMAGAGLGALGGAAGLSGGSIGSALG